MADRKKRVGRPATTPEGREQQLTSAAYDLAERQLRDGTASSQVITHFLKAGATREALEQERLRGENILLEAKAGAMASAARTEELIRDALGAMRSYQGLDDGEPDYDDY